MNMFKVSGRVVRAVGALSAATACVVALGACGSSDDGAGASAGKAAGGSAKQVRLAMFVSSTANTYNQAALAGVKKIAAQLGDTKVQAFGSDFDPNKQVQQIQTATASGRYNAYVIFTLDGVRVLPAIKAAKAKGIAVVCGFSVCGPDQAKFAKELPELATQTGINAGKLGDDAAPIVNAACKGKSPCRVVLMYGLAQLVSEKWYANHLKAGLDPNVQIVATGQGQFLADASYKAFKDILQAHRNVDVVVSPGDQMIVGSEQAIDEAGLEGHVALIGTGASTNAVKAIKAGRWYGSAILRPYNDGFISAENAIKAARGERVPAVVDASVAPDFPTGVITKANVDAWKPEWDG
jgi:ribose transport system substrate-binding protein